MLASKRTTISTVFSVQHTGRVDSKGLGASLSPTLHPIYALGALLGPSTIVREGTKSTTLDRLGGPWCTRQLLEGGIYKEEPAASRQTYSAAVVGFRDIKTTQRQAPFCWPLGALKVSEESSYLKAITQFYFCPAFVSPKPSPVLHYPYFILMFLGDLLFSFFDILENKISHGYTKVPARNFLSPLFPSLTHLGRFPLLGLNYLGFLRGIRLTGLGLLFSL